MSTKRRKRISFGSPISPSLRNLYRVLIWALLIGAGSGLGAVAFRKLISFFTWFFFTEYAGWTRALGPVRFITIPVIGALIFGPMIWRFAREARGHGVPEVMEAVALKGGRIRPVVAVIKSLASSLDIGSGGAVGREGPIAQIGAALASSLGQLIRVPPRLLRLAVAAGTAGGISATFNAPVAGALFGMEVILREFSTESFIATGVAAVVADAVSVPFLGSKPFFVLPAGTGLHSPYELFLYALLGVLSAGVGAGFTWILYWTEDRFNETALHEAIRPAAGAVLLGVLIMFLPPVRGLGYSVMAVVFSQHMALGTMALFLAGKFVASVLTLGSGGSGGIFTPTLYMGTMLGGAFGVLAHALFGGMVGNVAGYALVGAAAVFAGAARAPLTGVIIVMEMSQNYVLALPLLIAVGLGTQVGDQLLAESIYTLKLARRGVRLLSGARVDVLQHVNVREAMATKVPVIEPGAMVAEAALRLHAERRSSFPVLQDGRLRGVVTVTDLERAQEDSERVFTVADVMTTDVLVAYPDESLRDAVRRMAHNQIGQLLVVDPRDPGVLVGLLRRVDVVNMLERRMQASEEAEEPQETPRDRNGLFVRVQVPPASALVRHTLREIGPRFPAGTLVVSVTRGRQTFVSHGDTVLMPGDTLMLYVVPPEAEAQVRSFVAAQSLDDVGNRPPPSADGAAGARAGAAKADDR